MATVEGKKRKRRDWKDWNGMLRPLVLFVPSLSLVPLTALAQLYP